MSHPLKSVSPRFSAVALGLALILVLAASVVAAAAGTPTEAPKLELPTYTILRTPQPITIDGVLDESIWSRLQTMHFTWCNGHPAVFETEAKACWDDEYLYIAFSCVDNDIWGTYTKRDEPLYLEEVVEVFLNPTNDLRHYFEFEVSPRNVIWDGRIIHTGDRYKGDTRWDATGLRTGVRVVGTLDDRTDIDQSWTVEMAIPFFSIAKTPVDGERWRGNLYRIDRGKVVEHSCWSPTASETPAFHVPWRFGHLVFSTKNG